MNPRDAMDTKLVTDCIWVRASGACFFVCDSSIVYLLVNHVLLYTVSLDRTVNVEGDVMGETLWPMS